MVNSHKLAQELHMVDLVAASCDNNNVADVGVDVVSVIDPLNGGFLNDLWCVGKSDFGPRSRAVNFV